MVPVLPVTLTENASQTETLSRHIGCILNLGANRVQIAVLSVHLRYNYSKKQSSAFCFYYSRRPTTTTLRPRIGMPIPRLDTLGVVTTQKNGNNHNFRVSESVVETRKEQQATLSATDSQISRSNSPITMSSMLGNLKNKFTRSTGGSQEDKDKEKDSPSTPTRNAAAALASMNC